MKNLHCQDEKQQYKGDLREPISSNLSDQAFERVVRRKLRLLYKHYGITGGTWIDRLQELAVCLAFAHVPGFRVSSGRGRGRPLGTAKWSEVQLLELFLNMETIIVLQKEKAFSAARILASSDRWCEWTAHTLYRRHSSARQKWGSGWDGIMKALRQPPRGALADL